MAKPNKQVIIDEIVKCISKSDKTRDMERHFTIKYDIHRATFHKYLIIANEQHKIERQRINEAIERDTTVKEIEAVKNSIMTVIERKEYLRKVIFGEIVILKAFNVMGVMVDHPIVSDQNERLKALAELNKMEGDYAPVRTDITSGGQVLGMESILYQTKRRESND